MGSGPVGFLTFDFIPILGGQGRHFAELVPRLVARGLNCIILSPRHNTFEGHHSLMPWVLRLPFGQLLFSFGINIVIHRIIKRHKLRLLVINGGPGGVFLLRRIQIPVIYIANHTYRQQAQAVSGESWKEAFVPLEKRSYALAEKIVAISQGTAQALITDYGITPDKIVTIPIGVMMERYRLPNEMRKPNSILYVGRLDQRKGVSILVKAFITLKNQLPEATLTIAGSGPLANPLREQIRVARMDDSVALLGKVADSDLPLLYARHALLVIPSMLEGLGLVALEGLASGIPVVATDIPGLQDIIEHRKSGILVPSGDSQSMETAMADVLRNPEKYRAIALEGRKWVETRFSWEKVISDYENLLLCNLSLYSGTKVG